MIADQEQRDNTIARILCEVAALGTTSGPLYPGDANDMIHEHCKGDGAMSCGESHLSNGGLGGQKKRQRGVQHLKIVNSSGFSQQSLAMIFKTSLAQTIHHLDIQACSYVESDELHLLLETLPNLKFLDVRCRDQTGDLTPYSGLHLKKLPDEDALSGIEGDSSFSNAQLPSRLPLWSSHSSLEILRIGISNFTGMPIRVVENYDYERWITSAMLYHLKTHPLYNQPYPDSLLWVFDQLASLTQLKELCLVSAEAIFCKSQSLELTLKTGLAKLYTLKALECLDVEELNHAIGLEDVQWMVQHWPCLKQIRGLVRADQITLSEAALWLKANRPDIDLPVFKASN
ncbi:hypothetical protein EDD11_005152 [Mortierella claussenii]|nr:hypothetical protein EDD11_005152 [Mortierella claussenii]